MNRLFPNQKKTDMKSDCDVVKILVANAFSVHLIAYILFELIHLQSIEKHFVFWLSLQNHCIVNTYTIIIAFPNVAR